MSLDFNAFATESHEHGVVWARVMVLEGLWSQSDGVVWSLVRPVARVRVECSEEEQKGRSIICERRRLWTTCIPGPWSWRSLVHTRDMS